MGQKKSRVVGLAWLSKAGTAGLRQVETQPWTVMSRNLLFPPESHGCPRGWAMGREFAVSLQATRKPQEQFSCGLVRDLKHRLSGQEPESHSPTHCKSWNMGRGPSTGPSGVPLPTMGSRWRCGPGLARAAGRWKGGGNPERKTSGKQGFKRRTICSKTFAL